VTTAKLFARRACWLRAGAPWLALVVSACGNGGADFEAAQGGAPPIAGSSGDSAGAGTGNVASGAGGSAATGGAGGTPGASGDTGQKTVLVVPKPSTACSAPVPAPADGEHTLTVNAAPRGFILHLPPTYASGATFPLLLAFHGKGDKAEGWDGYSFKLGELAGPTNVLVYPQALPDPNLQNEPSFERDAEDDLVFTDALLAWLDANVCFDASRVFVVGHSLGSTFAQTLACRRGAMIRATATQAGDVGQMAACSGPVATWLGYGVDDSPKQLAASRARADFWLGQNVCDRAAPEPGDPAPPCLAYHCTAGAPVAICEDPAGTHKWGAWMTPSLLQFFATFQPAP
jgi:polyhydroxybutyrate depolymerase